MINSFPLPRNHDKMIDESVSNTRVYVRVSIYGLSLVRVIVLVIFGRSAVFHGGFAVFLGGSAGVGVSTNHKSSNRIELSQLGQDLFDI